MNLITSLDVVSQKSLSSLGEPVNTDPHLMSTHSTFARSTSNAANGLDMAANDRRSFATQSTASSGDISSPTGHGGTHSTSVFEYPSVDGVAAGRAAALGQLCRIVCAKSSKEQLPNEHVDLFKLGLLGVEVLLPNYLMALDIVLTESQKLRLHPSVHEVEMRNACLRTLASIITWPSTFGRRKIIPPNTSPKFTKSSSTNVLESDLCYIDLRSRILRMLVHTLRNETDATNIHLTLSLCFVFCAENALYDISKIDEAVLKEKKQNISENMPASGKQINSSVDVDESEKYFTISALRGVVSALCDNLSKTQWASDLPTCLAALDCLNSLATLPHSILFHQSKLFFAKIVIKYFF
uniref:Uncharacterized protein n=1 Tax=Ditylenchus dipsaci TaxID=166011 RepID=A0A915ETU8_9BILA